MTNTILGHVALLEVISDDAGLTTVHDLNDNSGLDVCSVKGRALAQQSANPTFAQDGAYALAGQRQRRDGASAPTARDELGLSNCEIETRP